METGYLRAFLNPLQEYFNGYKGIITNTHSNRNTTAYSFTLRSFISSCLIIDPMMRASVAELLQHPIFSEY
jgi:serine/threonine protein kinase